MAVSIPAVILLMVCILSISADNPTQADNDQSTKEDTPLSILILTSIYPAHFFPLVAIGEELVSRGHQVTMVGPTMEDYEHLPVEAESKGINFVSSSFEPRSTYDISRQSGKHDGSTSLITVFYNLTKQIKDNWNNSDNHFINMVRKLKEMDREYDYVVCDQAVISGVFYMISKGFDKVMISFSPLPIIAQGTSPWPFPKIGSSLTDNMSFKDRFINAAFFGPLEWGLFRFLAWMANLGPDMTYNGTLDDFLGTKFPVIFNTAIGFEFPRAKLPLQHFIGPILTRSPPPIDHTLNDWLDTKPVGSVLYVSMGTSVDVTMEIAEAILSLSQDAYLIWSCRNDLSSFSIDKDRVYVTKWTSQLAVLGHPSVGYSILQCGVTSVQESLYQGVPVVCIPSAFDQYDTALRLVAQGLGARIMPHELNEGSLRHALELVRGEAVRDKVTKMRHIMRSNGGSRRAADLVELYAVVGHDHGIPAYTRYNWYWWEYYNIDVYLVLMGIVGVSVWGLKWVCHWCYLRLCKCDRKKKDKKDKKE